MVKRLGKRKEIIIISCIFLLLLVGIAVFFLISGKEKEPVFTSEYDISWYDEGESQYSISTKEQLFGLADLSKTIDFVGKTIKLENDIVINEGNAKEWAEKAPDTVWIPITGFAGTFDGQGNTISGMYGDFTSGSAGMFVDTKESCVIRDFKLVNSYIYSQANKGTGSISSNGGGTFERIYTDTLLNCNGFYCGGIIGTMQEGVTIKECWYDGEITIGGSCAGGIAAALLKEKGEILHCLNTGLVNSTYPGPDPAIIGGLCGIVSKELTVEDSLNAGNVVSEQGLEQVGSLFGSVSGGTVEFDSVWTTKESAIKVVGYAKTGLNGLWGERMEKDLVGFGGYQKTDLDFEEHWAVVKEDTPILKYFADSVPEIPEMERAMVADITWYNTQKKEYVIRTAEELFGLARFTAQGYGNRFTDKTVKLGADIVFNEGDAKKFAEEAPLNEWTPIYNFTGTFDGKGYTISGLYGYTTEGTTTGMALFSGTREMTVVKDLKVTNSYFSTVTAHGLAAISSRGCGVFQNIYADAILVSAEQGSVGGILGMATKDGITIENCWSDCDITTAGRRAGGILANGNGKSKVVVKHCLNTGTLTRSFKNIAADHVLRTQTGLFGGIVGGTGTGSKGDYKGQFEILDCLNVGTIQSDRENDAIGGVAGGTSGLSADKQATVSIKNSYCTETSAAKIIGSKNSETNAFDVIRLDDEMLTGTEAYFYTSLNFAEYWTAVAKDTPVLKNFATSDIKTVAVKGDRSDVSWYQANQSEYVIKNAMQLYGLARLSFGGEKFEGKTIKLSADIIVNSGKASNWAAGSGKAERMWTPIRNFGGIFDGQGYSISGLYGIATGVHEERDGMGLFVETRDTAVLQNFTVKNSYFESTYANGLAAVSGRGGGNFKNLAVAGDVYLKNTLCGSVGGVLGIVTKTANIENCWSAAKITAAGQGVGGIVGNGNAQTVTIKHCLNTGTLTRSFKGLAEALKFYDYAKYPSYYSDTSTKAAYYGGIIGRTGAGSAGAYTGSFVIEDCVNTGLLTSEREKDALGGIVAQTTGLTKDGVATVTIKNVYATKSSCAKIIGSKNSETVVLDCMLLEDKKMTGEESYFYTALDFAKYWGAPRMGTPILKTFAKTTDNVISYNGEWSDISWYKPGEVNQTISDKADLYGMVRLSLAGETFAGKNIIVNATEPIIINEGDASKWADGTEALPEKVWIPIQGFAGTFNGNGCTISGIYSTQDADTGVLGIGLFAETNKATIQNLNLVNSYYAVNTSNGTGAITGQGSGNFANIYADVIMKDTNKKGFIGGILGKATDTVSVTNCWSECDITTNYRNIGGIVGDGNAKAVAIKHCLNSGNLLISSDSTQTQCYTGGIIGKTGAGSASKGWSGSFVIEDCLSTGVVKTDSNTATGTIGTLVGYATGANGEAETVSIVNSYGAVIYDESNRCVSAEKAVGSDYRTNQVGGRAVKDTKLMGINSFYYTELDFVTLLNADGYWSVREDAMPMLVTYLTESDQTIDVSGLSRDTFALVNNKGTIASLSQLMSFRDKMNAGSLPVDQNTVITLTEDIVMNEGNATSNWSSNAWTPIKGFPGIFDGGGNTISGLYVVNTSSSPAGFFNNTVATTVIRNLNITNCYYRVNTQKGCGVIIGQGQGTVENVYVNVRIVETSAGNKGRIGGIVGIADGNLTVRNCWNASSITSSGDYCGGILGNITGGGFNITIEHCLNTGNITSIYNSDKSQYGTNFGGMVGRANNGSATTGLLQITDCLNTGIVKGAASGGYYGALLGFGSKRGTDDVATAAITNSYSAINYNGDNVQQGVSALVGQYPERADLVDSTAVDSDNLKGDLAKTNAPKLDYVTDTNLDGYWTLRTGDLPMLTEFVER